MRKIWIVLLALCLLLASCTPNPEDDVDASGTSGTSDSGVTSDTTEAPTSDGTPQPPATEESTKGNDGAIHLPKVEF